MNVDTTLSLVGCYDVVKVSLLRKWVQSTLLMPELTLFSNKSNIGRFCKRRQLFQSLILSLRISNEMWFSKKKQKQTVQRRHPVKINVFCYFFKTYLNNYTCFCIKQKLIIFPGWRHNITKCTTGEGFIVIVEV